MEIKRFEGNGRMSKVVRFGDTLYLCGQVSQSGGCIQEQTKDVLGKIDALLTAHGSDKQHVLSALIHIKSMKEFALMNEVWDAWVEKGHEPARTCVEANMAAETVLVEITVVATVK